jgi:hypothetical protein
LPLPLLNSLAQEVGPEVEYFQNFPDFYAI